MISINMFVKNARFSEQKWEYSQFSLLLQCRIFSKFIMGDSLHSPYTEETISLKCLVSASCGRRHETNINSEHFSFLAKKS